MPLTHFCALPRLVRFKCEHVYQCSIQGSISRLGRLVLLGFMATVPLLVIFSFSLVLGVRCCAFVLETDEAVRSSKNAAVCGVLAVGVALSPMVYFLSPVDVHTARNQTR